MPRRNDRAHRGNAREYEFVRSLDCTEEDPCYTPKRKVKKGKGKKVKGNGSGSE